MYNNNIAEIIYDTLMQNTDNEQLDTFYIENQEIDNQNRRIKFDYQGMHVAFTVHYERITK